MSWVRQSRSPCGERGLKCYSLPPFYWHASSLPVRGAWIEIATQGGGTSRRTVAPPAGGVGLKRQMNPRDRKPGAPGAPGGGGGVESEVTKMVSASRVAPRAGSVD